MDFTKSVLENMRAAMGLSEDSTEFDTDLLIHINAAISTLHQNDACLPIFIMDTSTIWDDLKNPDKVEGNEFFSLIPLYVLLSTKIIFDPPPPSAVEYYQAMIKDTLWRLKIAYEEPHTTTTTTEP